MFQGGHGYLYEEGSPEGVDKEEIGFSAQQLASHPPEVFRFCLLSVRVAYTGCLHLWEFGGPWWGGRHYCQDSVIICRKIQGKTAECGQTSIVRVCGETWACSQLCSWLLAPLDRRFLFFSEELSSLECLQITNFKIIVFLAFTFDSWLQAQNRWWT